MQQTKKALLLLLFFVYNSFAQVENPSQNEFYSQLNGISTNLTFEFTETCSIKVFDSDKRSTPYNGNGYQLKIVLNSNTHTKNTDITLKNMILENFSKIIFEIHSASDIKINNIDFINCNNVSFLFYNKSNLYNTYNSTSVDLEYCLFEETALPDNYPIMLDFRSNTTQLTQIKDINIKNCDFEITDNHLPSYSGHYPDFTAVRFFRQRTNVSIRDVTIEDNNFDIQTKYYRSQGIDITQLASLDFQNGSDYYIDNRLIKILYNNFTTNSYDPNHAIHVKGPYKYVYVEHNVINNYGLNYATSSGSVALDGAIHLYGARDSGTGNYSDDIKYSYVRYNTINAKGSALNMIGCQYSTVDSNTIRILDWPVYWQGNSSINSIDRSCLHIGTGDFDDPNRQSKNITITRNKFYCENRDATIGILLKFPRLFTITNNKIMNPTTSGICYWSGTSVAKSDIGTSIINNNIIDFGGNNQSDLSSNFYLSNNQELCSAISFNRKDNIHTYTNESLELLGNNIWNGADINLFTFSDETDSHIQRTNSATGGTWTTAGFYSNKWYIGDFNGDGNSDIFRYSSSSDRVEVMLSNSKNHFGWVSTWETANNNGEWYVGDFNGDGKDDIMCTVSNTLGAKVYLSNGTSFNNPTTWLDPFNYYPYYSTNNYGKWYVGDFNGDGKDDIMGKAAPNGDARVWLSTGSSFNSNYNNIWLSSTDYSNDKWYIGDFDGDGDDDITCQVNSSGQAKVLFSNGTNDFYDPPTSLWLGSGNNGKWYIGDFNDDGKDDIMCPTSAKKGAKVWFSNGSNFMNQYQGIWLTDTNNGNWYIGDFDANGKDDIMGQLSQWGGANVHLSNGTSQMYKQSIDLQFDKELPTKFELSQNYPNPFNPTTTIQYQLSEPGFVSLKVYDALGKEVANLVNETKNIGYYKFNFNASNLSSGIYFYTLRVNDFVSSKKMLLVK